jgi:hypothetical protein
MVRAPNRRQSLLEQVQKTDAEVHIPLASPANKKAAASLGQALLTPDGARLFDQARFRTHFVLEPTDHSKALFDRFRALASASREQISTWPVPKRQSAGRMYRRNLQLT